MARKQQITLGCLVALMLAAPDALAHSGTPITAPGEQAGLDLAYEFGKYGAKHILLGYDHLLFLAGLALLTRGLRDLVAIAGLFALSYSLTLVGGTLAGISVPGDLIDAIIALSVGFVGVQIAFSDRIERLPRSPRPTALCFGLAHGLGLSSLLQDLRLEGDDLLPSVIGFNVGVEAGQLAALAVFIAALMTLRAFPFPEPHRIPAGFAFGSAALALLSFLALGVDL